ncbi:hypothetical protein C0989_005167 [Termitomyces sp. Mn162]|nr:hypothetical protein C0989_005167 [Termitomyces sp. Mn162]
MSDWLMPAQVSTVFGFCLNVASLGQNVAFHTAHELPIHLQHAQTYIQKTGDDLRDFTTFLTDKEMKAFYKQYSKLQAEVENMMDEYDNSFLVRRYWTLSETVPKAINLKKRCLELSKSVWSTSTLAKFKAEMQQGLNLVEKSHDTISDHERSPQHSGPEEPEYNADPEPPKIETTCGVRLSLPNFLGTMLPFDTAQKSTFASEVAFEMTTLNRDGHAIITSTPGESTNK